MHYLCSEFKSISEPESRVLVDLEEARDVLIKVLDFGGHSIAVFKFGTVASLPLELADQLKELIGEQCAVLRLMAATGFAAWMRKPMPDVSKIVIIKAILGASLIIFVSYNIWCYGFWNYLNESILPFIRDIFVEIISGVASMIVVKKILHD